MIKKITLLLALVILTMSGCSNENNEHVQLVLQASGSFTIVSVDPPVDVYVTIQDRDGNMYSDLFVGKTFPNWNNKLVAGRNIKLSYKDFQVLNEKEEVVREYREFPNLTQELSALSME